MLALPEFSGLEVGRREQSPGPTTRAPARKRKGLRNSAPVRLLLRHPLTSSIFSTGAAGRLGRREGGRSLFRLSPAGPEIAGLLHPAPEVGRRGRRSRQGLEVVRRQPAPETGVRCFDRVPGRPPSRERPEKGGSSRWLQALPASSSSTRELTPHFSFWTGLENYLKQGGNPEVLADALAFRQTSTTPPPILRGSKDRALNQMVHWDAAAVRGLEALHRLRAIRRAVSFANPLHVPVRKIPQGVAPTLRNIVCPGPLREGAAGDREVSATCSATGRRTPGRRPRARAGVPPGRAPRQHHRLRAAGGIVDPATNREFLRIPGRPRDRRRGDHGGGSREHEEVVLATREVKEIIDTRQLRDARVIRQLAKDILNDAITHAAKPFPPGTTPPTLRDLCLADPG